jgi:glycerol-3-phosphate dehydrogenase
MKSEQVRESSLSEASTQQWDLIVVGGGITGAGVAREAVRAGLSVLVLEQKDFAWGTSSRSSKMVHGGLRYLASGNLGLTRHSVQEREALMQEAPGLVDKMSYVWPHFQGQFPGPMIFDSLLRIYDAFSGHSYRRFWSAEQVANLIPYLKTEGLLGATQFADAVTDDVRLVMRVLSEVSRSNLSSLFNYTKVVDCDTTQGCVEVEDQLNGNRHSFKAQVIVNATGAWADKLRPNQKHSNIRPCRGSHLVFAQWQLPVFAAVTLYHPDDGRALFIYPWESVAVVGTTDIDHPNLDDSEVHITQQEVDYLLRAVQYMFPNLGLNEQDVISSWAGVRPIVSSSSKIKPSAEKRDHSIWVDQRLVTVSGGKLTTFRLIALDVMKRLSQMLTKDIPLQKGPLFCKTSLQPQNPLFGKLPYKTRKRLLGVYGDEVEALLLKAKEADYEPVPGMNTLWAEVRWAAAHEQVQHLDDLLLRRVRIGLMLPNAGAEHKTRIQYIVQQELGWPDGHWSQEWERYLGIWQKAYSLPNRPQSKVSEPAESLPDPASHRVI